MKNGKKDRILRILLNKSGPALTKYKIAKLTDCSEAWVGEFIKTLEQNGFVQNTEVVDQKGLYAYWLGIRAKPESRIYLIENPIKLLGEVDMDYAATTYLGETLTQHHLFHSRTDVYVNEEDSEKWLALLNEKGLFGGGNFKIILVDKYFFYGSQEVYVKEISKKIKVVSQPQLILDLLAEGGSCVEAAELLMGDKNGISQDRDRHID